MLTDIDEQVLASVNLHAVFGALPRLAELAPEASALLASLDRPVTLTLQLLGGATVTLVFDRLGVTRGEPRRGTSARLVFRTAAHLNAVVAGTAQPIPVAGPAGIRFLSQVFTPFAALLDRYLQPSDSDLADAAFAEANMLLTLDVAATAMTVVANEDRSGRFSAAQMPDGDLDIDVVGGPRYRLRVHDHTVTRVTATAEPARAVFGFASLAVAGDVLAGRESAIACVSDGRIALRGYIPLVDNASRILDRVGHYLGK